jgi:hypothetical protein
MALNEKSNNYECDYCHAVIENPRVRKVNGKDEVQRFCSGTKCKNNWWNSQKINITDVKIEINKMLDEKFGSGVLVC